MPQTTYRRPTADDFNWPSDVTPQEQEDFLKKQPPVKVEAVQAPPPQGISGFLGRATQSLNPMNYARGIRDTVMDLPGTVQGIANVPIGIAGGAIDAARQGDYLRAGRKALTAAVPFAGAVAGGLATGGAGIIPGYLAGTGVAAGLDEAGDQMQQGNVAAGLGASVDAGVQGWMGSRASGGGAGRAATPAEQAAALEQKVGKISARTLAPTIGENRYALGNQAREIGGQMLKSTTGWSVDTMHQQLESLRSRATANLDAAYDLIPSGVRMKTADVKAGLRAELNKVLVQDARGNWVAPAGKTEYASALQKAIAELDTMPSTLDAPTIRNLRQGWDNLAHDVWEPKTNAGWQKVRAEGKAYADARTVLNEQTKKTFPHLGPQMAETTFALQATDLLRALDETENARSRIGRRIMSTSGGVAAGLLQGGPAGAAVGAVLAPTLEYLMTERLGPGGKIQAARTMANMASELRKNGQTPTAMRYAQELRALTQTAGQAGRANIAAGSRDAMQPPAPEAPVSMEQAAASGQSPTNWFNTVLQKSGGQ